MTLTRERLTFITLVVSESAWLFAFISILGVAAGASGSPISFFAILGLLGLSTFLYSYIRRKEFKAFELFYFGATALGLVLAYLVVAAAYFDSEPFTLDWIFKVTDSTIKPQGQTFQGVAGGILAVGMWFRGIRLSMVPYPEKSLTISFRMGLFFIGFAAIMDILVEQELNVFAMVLIFFGSGLAGLNIGHLVPETSTSAETKTWPKVIGLAVVVVVIVGAMFGFLQQSFLEWLTSPIKFVFDRIVEGVLLIIGVPLVLGLEVINTAMAAFFGREGPMDVIPDASATPTPTPGARVEFEGGGSGGDIQVPKVLEDFTQVVRYGLVVAALVVAGLFLYVLMRRIGRKLRKKDEAERESILDEMNFGSDIGDLFSDLLSNVTDLFKGAARKVFRLPDGPPGVVEALRLYYQMITTAEQNEVARPEHYTPNEFRRGLRSVFPNELVDPATEAFNRAQYGDIPATNEEIAKMRASFRVEKQVEAGPQTQAGTRKPKLGSGALGREARFETITSEIIDDPLARQRARFDSPSLTERNWFTGMMGVLVACGGIILFSIVAAVIFGLVVFIGGA